MKKPKAGGKKTSLPVAAPNALGPVDLQTIRALARIATEFDLAEVEAEPSGRIRIRRGAVAALSAAPVEHRLSSPAALSLMPALTDAPVESAAAITSPFVGTFYGAPTPDAPAFVEVGKSVRKGQVVCIIEAMKLMNEIESEVDGKVVEVLVKNGTHVEYGQLLFRVAKS